MNGLIDAISKLPPGLTWLCIICFAMRTMSKIAIQVSVEVRAWRRDLMNSQARQSETSTLPKR